MTFDERWDKHLDESPGLRAAFRDGADDPVLLGLKKWAELGWNWRGEDQEATDAK